MDAELAAQRATRDKESVEAANQQARGAAAEQSEREKQEAAQQVGGTTQQHPSNEG
jgi:hypothetical protein